MGTLIKFRATPKSPLVIRTSRKAHLPGTLDHIPGSTLRGAILAEYWKLYGDNENFHRFLEPDRNRFPFLLPGDDVLPMPRSVLACKYHPGKHGYVDILVSRYLAGKNSDPKYFKDYEDFFTCSAKGCGKERKTGDGYYKLPIDPKNPKKKLYSRQPADKIILAHRMNVGINRITKTAQQHILFGSQFIETQTQSKIDAEKQLHFTGSGYLHEEDLELVKQLCEYPIFIGKSRSRGFGQVKIEFETINVPPNADFNLKQNSKRLKQACGVKEGQVFTLDVISPIVSFDKYLRPALDPQLWLPTDLKATVLENFLGQQIVSGWDLALGMPKDDQVAIAPGSVILAKSSLKPEELAERLIHYEKFGIGERRDEGFGRVIVNDPCRIQR